MDQSQIRVRQISDSHCGVAALEILLKEKGVNLNQRELSRLAGVEKLIYQRGVQVEEMAEAVAKLGFGHVLKFKRDATLSDVEEAVKRGFLVGVEWQGLFREQGEIDQKWAKLGYLGHYSVVRGINVEKDVLVMTDPYRAFFERDRVFSAKWFEGRWWDWNLVDVGGGIKRWVKHRKTMFVIA